MLNAREAAYKIIASYKRSGAYSEIALDNIIKREHLSERDAALTGSIALGTIQNLYFLDYYIGCYCSLPVKKLSPAVLSVLELSAYQILFLDRIPARAAINEGVELTKKYGGKKASGLVNAVLRRISENSENLPPIQDDSFSEYISIKYSVSRWFSEEMISRLGKKDAEEFFRICNLPPDVTVNTNNIKTTAEDAKKILSDLNIGYTEADGFPGTFIIKKAAGLINTDYFKCGLFYVQDVSARCAVLASGVKSGGSVLDVCAAPGGKSILAALLMENTGRVISCDIHGKKLGKIEENASRLGISIIETRQADAKEFVNDFENAFDTVLADVPCSGFGVIRKKPEIKYKAYEDIEGLNRIQLDILRNSSRYVKPGGVLIYSTCTVLQRENEDVVTAFLAGNDEFFLEKFTVNNKITAENGYTTLWPHINGSDGFFVARLRRRI